MQFVEHADNGVLDAAELNTGTRKAGAALAAFDKTVGWVIEPLRALFDARRTIRQGGWDDADVQRAAALVRQVGALRGALDEAGPSEEQVGGLRSEIKGIEKDRESGAGRIVAAEAGNAIERAVYRDVMVAIEGPCPRRSCDRARAAFGRTTRRRSKPRGRGLCATPILSAWQWYSKTLRLSPAGLKVLR